jgi:hypothetical protein
VILDEDIDLFPFPALLHRADNDDAPVPFIEA